MRTFTLREVALALAKAKNPRSTGIADGDLLRLLRSGDLSAGFVFPGLRPYWIAIGPDYWSGVTAARFRSIRKDEGGTFLVDISRFVDVLWNHVRADLEAKTAKQPADFRGQTFKRALLAALDQYEVVIEEAEWEQYKSRNDLNEPQPASKRGRHPLEGWRHLAILIPAFILANNLNRSPKFESAANQLLDLARKQWPNVQFPSAHTLADVLANIDKEAESIRQGINSTNPNLRIK